MNLRSDREILDASLASGYVGGGYYNPVEEFDDVARPVSSVKLMELIGSSDLSMSSGNTTYYIARLYSELQSLLNPGELLFAMYDNSKYKIAALIHGEERLLDFESQVDSGALRRCGFFAASRDDAADGLARDYVPTSPGSSGA